MTTHLEPHSEAGLPVLSRGAHASPRDGACLMEYVSVLAGEEFSDHPRCTDPLLAHVARQVNDATSVLGRNDLARLAPDLIGTAPAEVRTRQALVERCVHVARTHGTARLPHARIPILSHSRTAHMRRIERAVAALRRLPIHAGREAALYHLLATAAAVYHPYSHCERNIPAQHATQCQSVAVREGQDLAPCE